MQVYAHSLVAARIQAPIRKRLNCSASALIDSLLNLTALSLMIRSALSLYRSLITRLQRNA